MSLSRNQAASHGILILLQDVALLKKIKIYIAEITRRCILHFALLCTEQ
jgi:hypothetical protein